MFRFSKSRVIHYFQILPCNKLYIHSLEVRMYHTLHERTAFLTYPLQAARSSVSHYWSRAHRYPGMCLCTNLYIKIELRECLRGNLIPQSSVVHHVSYSSLSRLNILRCGTWFLLRRMVGISIHKQKNDLRALNTKVRKMWFRGH